MSTRRSHPKSRRGCMTCKSRHVRCDEEGPPCGRCKTRGTECRYAIPKTNPPGSSPFQPPPDSNPPNFPGPADHVRQGEVIFPASRNLLELQLMHRWSAITYKSCCSPGSDDDEVWQYLVPNLAIQHDFLRFGIFSLSAFETAQMTKTLSRQKYINTAIEYHSLALSKFQSHLPTMSPESHEAALCMSLLLICLTFASAQATARPAYEEEHGSMTHAVISHFELVRGCAPVLQSKENYASKNAYIRRLKRFEDLPRTAMDIPTEEAFVKLSDLNDKRIMATVLDTDERRLQHVTYWESCKKALALLRECYERCVDNLSQGYALGWLNMAGEGYVKAIKEGDNISLLILMYWGVLIERIDHRVWWAEDYGRLLVVEIASKVAADENDTAFKDVIIIAHNLIETAK